jgi:hypothetical protein
VGGHSFAVRAKDAAGNVDATPASYAWTITAAPVADTTPPETAIATGPAASTTDTTAAFTFTANEAGSTFACSLDGAAATPCTSPVSYTGLAVGAHTFAVHAIDPAANADPTPAPYSWTITAPAPPSCTAAPVTVGSVADSWVLQSSPSNNHGTDSVLKIDSKNGSSNARALVRFDLPAIPAGCTVTGMQLRMYSGSAVNGRTLQVLQAAAAWTEGGVTWANQPGTIGTAVTTTSGSGWRQWNVTALAPALYGANHGFIIRDATEGGNGHEQQLHSKEKAPDNPPQLVITFG